VSRWGELDGYDAAYLRRHQPWLGAVVRRWFRVRVRGLEEAPDGPALFVGNHSGATMIPDTLCWIDAWAQSGRETPLRLLAHDQMFDGYPEPVAAFLSRMGGLRASHDRAVAALRAGQAVTVYPGGDHDACRTFWRRHEIELAGRTGYVEVAREAGVPIVPVVSCGAHEALLVLAEGRRLARWLGLDRSRRLTVFPLTLSVPWGLWLGPLPGYLPLPTKVELAVLDPIDPTDGDVDAVDRRVRQCLQAGGAGRAGARGGRAEPSLRPRPDEHDYQLTYPPAVQLERGDYGHVPTDADWVRHAVGDFTNAGYYFHFGFCRYRCRYCFHYELKTTRGEALMARYVDALDREMAHVSSLTRRVKPALYFLGGGTPTALPLRLLERFLDRLTLRFGPPMTAMSTVEAKPVTASDDKLRALVSAGFRRINLGVQTFDPALYAFHHHGEDVRVAHDAIARARRAGFDWINVDLMTGLERQDPASFARTLRVARRLALDGAIDSVFLYPFHDDPRSKTFGDPGKVPPFVETAASDATAREVFADELGWSELGARFYRSPRHVRREVLELLKVRANPAYGESLYHGFGNSSFSIGDRATYLNHRDVVAYCDAVEARGSGIARWTTLDDAQRATRDVTFDLLYSPVTRVRSRARKYGRAAMRAHRRRLERWVDLGLGSFDRLLGTFSLSRLGKLLHQQMIPQHYLPRDRRRLDTVMTLRKELGRRYRGY